MKIEASCIQKSTLSKLSKSRAWSQETASIDYKWHVAVSSDLWESQITSEFNLTNAYITAVYLVKKSRLIGLVI